MNIKEQIEVYNFEERIGGTNSIGIFYKYMQTDNFILSFSIRNKIQSYIWKLYEIRK